MILTPYYLPDAGLLRSIRAAVKRGVSVDVLVPWRTDHGFVHYIAQRCYELTVGLGARLHFLPRMNHGKALIIDNSLGAVGSVNITSRSFYHNEESAAVFNSATMVDDLRRVLGAWREQSYEPAELKAWTRRVLGRAGTFLEKLI